MAGDEPVSGRGNGGGRPAAVYGEARSRWSGPPRRAGSFVLLFYKVPKSPTRPEGSCMCAEKKGFPVCVLILTNQIVGYYLFIESFSAATFCKESVIFQIAW